MHPALFTELPATEAAATTAAVQPQISPLVIVGPREFLGGRPMHFAKLRGSTRYFRMGEKEVYLLSRMDGKRTPEQIQVDYAQAFRKRLSLASWNKAVSLFEQRGLLLTEEAHAAPVTEASTAPMGRVQTGPFSHKLVNWNPDMRLGSLARFARFFINGPVLTLWLLLVVACELVVLRNFNQVWAVGSHLSGSVIRAIVFISILTATTALHEFGHAVACKRFGGEVRELGLLVRYFMVCAYARIDDILLLTNRRQRLYVLLMGPLVSLSVIPVALAFWLRTPPHTLAHSIAADLLLWYNFGCLMQFLPFLKLDGYYMLAQLLKMPELRTDSYNYLAALGKHWLGRGEGMVISSDCARYVQPTYVLYGVFSSLATAAFVLWTLARYSVSLRHLLGVPWSLFVTSLLGAMIAWRLYTEVFSKWRPGSTQA